MRCQWSSPVQGPGTEWRPAGSQESGSRALGKVFWALSKAARLRGRGSTAGRALCECGLWRAHCPASPQRPPVGRVRSGRALARPASAGFRFRFAATLQRNKAATTTGDASAVRGAERGDLNPGPTGEVAACPGPPSDGRRLRKKKMESLLLETCLRASHECPWNGKVPRPPGTGVASSSKWSNLDPLQEQEVLSPAEPSLQLQLETSQWICSSSAFETPGACISPGPQRSQRICYELNEIFY